MIIIAEVIVHEAAHLAVGHFLRISEQGIVFSGVRADETAVTWYSNQNVPLEKIIVRSLLVSSPTFI
jgi:hypothetical protein